MAGRKFELRITGETTAYLRLPGYPKRLRIARTVPLVDIMGKYKGPYVVFDFDESGEMVGIEIVGEEDVEESENEGVDI